MKAAEKRGVRLRRERKRKRVLEIRGAATQWERISNYVTRDRGLALNTNNAERASKIKPASRKIMRGRNSFGVADLL